MTKQQRKNLIRSVWSYLSKNLSHAADKKNMMDFDWYSEGQQMFFCIITETEYKYVRRTRDI